MQGIHFTVIGALLTIAIAYWLIRYGSNSYTVATGGTKAIANIPRVFTKDPGLAPNQA